jgi:hypothetical protein
LIKTTRKMMSINRVIMAMYDILDN